jgi:hypothetical protein
MAKPGPKSAAEQAITIDVQQVRPDAPEFLTANQKRLWAAIVADIPADWFVTRAQYVMLIQLTRHIDEADKIAATLEAEGFDDLDRRSKLQTQQRAESSAILALMRSMRLTNQSTQSEKRKPTVPSGKPPWQT